MKISGRHYNNYLRELAEEAVAAFFFGNEYAFVCKDQKGITDALIARLQDASGDSLDALFRQELKNEGILTQYLNRDASFTNQFEAADRILEERLCDKATQFLKHTSPNLCRILQTTIQNYLKLINEVLEHYCFLKNSISTVLFQGKDPGRIIEFHVDAGDAHNHGKTVVILKTEAGKCVYKPHDFSIDQFMSDLTDTFFPDITRYPALVLGKGYGFCEYIETRAVTGKKRIAEYYEKVGGLCAVFNMLQSKDLHSENFLCDGFFPILIDAEMVVSPEAFIEKSSRFYLFPELERTLYKSGLFSNLIGDREISPLFNRTKNNKLAALYRGKPVDIIDYQESFLTGFERIYHRILRHKKELAAFMNRLESAQVRVLLACTADYAKLLSKSRKWGWVQSNNLKTELDSALYRRYKECGKRKLHAIAKAESEALLEGDIPYFYTMAGSHDLYSGGMCIVKKFFRKSCLEVVQSGLRNMSIKNLQFEKNLFILEFQRMKGRSSENNKKTETEKIRRHEKPITPDECIERAERIFRRIREEAVLSPKGNLYFFSFNDDGTSEMIFQQGSLAQGYMGTAVFVTALAAVSRNEETIDECMMVLNTVFSMFNSYLRRLEKEKILYPSLCPPGYYEGVAGNLFALGKIIEIIRRTREESENVQSGFSRDFYEQARNLSGRCFDLIGRLDTNTMNSDPLHGLPGLISVLADPMIEINAPWERRRKLVRDFSDLLLKKGVKTATGILLWKEISKEFLSGMGHGQCGVATALYKAGILLKREDYLKAADDAFLYEDGLYRSELNGWPDLRDEKKSGEVMHGYCSGAPGVGLAMLTQTGGIARKNLNRVERSIGSCPLLASDHLCCGNSASVEYLLEAGLQLMRPDLIRKAGEILSAVSARADRAGGYFCGNNSFISAGDPSLYYGTTGIGYELLRFARPRLIPGVMLA